MPSLTFLGAAETVTGSKHLLDTGERRVLVDCGLFQGLKPLRERNWQPLPVTAVSIDAVVLTHAHLDHCGYLPRLTAAGFNGPVWCTPAHASSARSSCPTRRAFRKRMPGTPIARDTRSTIPRCRCTRRRTRNARFTRFFSWGPYERVEEPQALHRRPAPASASAARCSSSSIDHREHGPIGVTGLSELVARATAAPPSAPGSAATAGGSGANLESKALVARARVRDARARAPDRVGEHAQRPLAGARSSGSASAARACSPAWHRHGDERARRRGVPACSRAAWEALAAARHSGGGREAPRRRPFQMA